MDIGTKIREARAAAHLTQEQAAEALGGEQANDIELGEQQDLPRYRQRDKDERSLLRES